MWRWPGLKKKTFAIKCWARQVQSFMDTNTETNGQIDTNTRKVNSRRCTKSLY